MGIGFRAFLGAVILSVSSESAIAEPALDLTVTRGGEELRENLLAAMTLDDLLGGEEPSQQAILAAAQADYARLVTASYEAGRYGPVVSIKLDGREAAAISPFGAPATIRRIDIRVDPGPRFRFGRAEIAPLPPGDIPPEDFRAGEVARLGAIRDAVSSGVSDWRSVGHAKAELASQDIDAIHPETRLDVLLRLAPGPKLRFGDVIVTGNDAVRRTRIREIAGIPQGEVFDPDTLREAEARLRRTGVFRSAAISEADRANPDGTLDLALRVAEEKPRRFGFGAEISTQEGGKLSAFWLHRNLFGGAERLRVEAEIAGIDAEGDALDYRLALTYGRPATFTPDTDFYLTAVLEHLEEPGYVSDQFTLSSGLNHRFSDALSGRFGLGYRYSDTQDAFGARQFSLFTMTLAATLDERDNALDPKNGYYLSAEATPFLGMDGTSSGLRLTTDARGYLGLGPDDRFVLAGRAQIGSIWGPELSETVPDYLFYSGGGGTVRGQPYQSLGVEAPNGELTGGQSFAALSAELRTQLRDRIGVVGFYDMGYVSAGSGFSGDGDWHAGAGVGLRYDTGIGPIRLDLATPTTGDEAGRRLDIYIGIGQAF